jgi:hypothetical protein
MISKTSSQLKVIEVLDYCEVRIDIENAHKGLFSRKNYSKGDLIIGFGSTKLVETPNYLTVQIAIDQHIHLSPDYLQFINHSCNPNVLFNTTTMELESVRDVIAGDEFTFFYPATEWKMSQKFECHCGEKNCIGLIQGAADTFIKILNQYKLTHFIQSMLIEKGYSINPNH